MQPMPACNGLSVSTCAACGTLGALFSICLLWRVGWPRCRGNNYYLTALHTCEMECAVLRTFLRTHCTSCQSCTFPWLWFPCSFAGFVRAVCWWVISVCSCFWIAFCHEDIRYQNRITAPRTCTTILYIAKLSHSWQTTGMRFQSYRKARIWRINADWETSYVAETLLCTCFLLTTDIE